MRGGYQQVLRSPIFLRLSPTVAMMAELWRPARCHIWPSKIRCTAAMVRTWAEHAIKEKAKGILLHKGSCSWTAAMDKGATKLLSRLLCNKPRRFESSFSDTMPSSFMRQQQKHTWVVCRTEQLNQHISAVCCVPFDGICEPLSVVRVLVVTN